MEKRQVLSCHALWGSEGSTHGLLRTNLCFQGFRRWAYARLAVFKSRVKHSCQSYRVQKKGLLMAYGVQERPQKGELMSFVVQENGTLMSVGLQGKRVLLSCGVQERGTLMLCEVRRRE